MSTDPIKPYRWFAFTPKPHAVNNAVKVVQMLVGVAVAAVFWIAGQRVLAVVIASVAVVIGAMSLGSRGLGDRISRFFGHVGHWIGRLIGVLILSPIYLVGFTVARGWMRLTGADPLRLRERDSATYWLASDRDQRKVKHIAAMFATEAPTGPQRRWLPILAAILMIALVGEGVLRWVGFGRTILYVPDAIAGYYPAPDQRTTWLGKHIDTNRYGMRSPDHPDEKKPGALRILMLGDSTLWGGLYIDQEDLYARRLEGLLDDAGANGGAEVWNVGVNAWGPFHELGYVERFGVHDADIAVICLPINDVFRPLYGLEKLSFMTPERPPRCAWEEVLFHLVWRYREGRLGKPSEESWNVQGERGVEAYVQLARRLRDAGCEVLIEILPSREGGITNTPPDNKRRWSARLREALESQGFTVGYPVGLFADGDDADAIYHDHVHLDRAGHHAYANYLAKRLSAESSRVQSWLAIYDSPEDDR